MTLNPLHLHSIYFVALFIQYLLNTGVCGKSNRFFVSLRISRTSFLRMNIICDYFCAKRFIHFIGTKLVHYIRISKKNIKIISFF